MKAIALLISLFLTSNAFGYGQVYIGRSKTMDSGISVNQKSEKIAKYKAKKQCGQHCNKRYGFRNRCFAYAVADWRKSNAYGFASNKKINAAKKKALANCNEYGVKCTVLVSGCDNGNKK